MDSETLPLSFEQIDANLFKGLVPSTNTLIGIFAKSDDGQYVQQLDDDIVTYKNVKMSVVTLRMLLIYESI